MITIEQVEKLREYGAGNISFEEARRALEEADGSLLEAVILLEKQGKIRGPETAGGSGSESRGDGNRSDKTKNGEWTQNKSGNGGASGGNYESNGRGAKYNSESFGDMMKRFLKWCGRVIQRGNRNSFEVSRRDEHIVSIPVTVMVLLTVFGFWVVIPLLVVGLFFDYRYSFRGPDLGKDSINNVMDKTSNAADGIKKSVKDAVNEEKSGNDSDNYN